MPTVVEKAAAAAAGDDDAHIHSGGDTALPTADGNDAEPEEDVSITGTGDASSTASSHQDQDNDVIDYTHLVDSFKEPLHSYPYCVPTPLMKAAYTTQRYARKQYDAARKARENFELNTLEEKLGRLHNLVRESKERERAARKELRSKTYEMYEMELTESGEKYEFNEWVSKIKAYIKKNKGLPPSLEYFEAWTGQAQLTGHDVATWIHTQLQQIQDGTSTLEPHQLATLENLGIVIPLSEEDLWQRSYNQFLSYSKEYWDSPIRIQNTNGDVVRSIMEFSTDEERRVLQQWCMAQQVWYESNGFEVEGRMDWYTKLVDAGFTFDAIVSDEQWDESIEMISQFKSKFGHVHIPEDYIPNSMAAVAPTLEDRDRSKASKLRSLITKVQTLVHRDALSTKRMASLKKADLYLDMGGRVYAYHVQYCKDGRRQRAQDEEEKMEEDEGDRDEQGNTMAVKNTSVGTGDGGERLKRKFKALVEIERADRAPKKTHTRGSIDLWNKKLEKLVAYKEKYGIITDIQNDVKLRSWTYSVIRKLSINSTTLKGQKMSLIEKHNGLKEFLLQKENVAAAVQAGRANRDSKVGVGNGTIKDDGDGDGEDKDVTGAAGGESKDDNGLEELAEDVLLGNKEDHEVDAFMQSGDL